MRNAMLLVVALPVLSATACADFDATCWRYQKRVEGPSQSGYYALQLDAEVLAGADPSLSDLRLVTDAKAEQPYELRVESDQQRLEPVPVRPYNVSRVPKRGRRFEVDLGAAERMTSQLTIESPDRDFRYQVTVEGSPDSREWAVLRKDGAIFDFRGDAQARSMLVNVPETTFRFLRVTVHDTDAHPFTVSGVEIARVSQPARRQELKAVSVSVQQVG